MSCRSDSYIISMRQKEKTKGATLICAFEGWNDASRAATNVIRHLVDVYDAQEIRSISSDSFYDYQVSRPMVCNVTGVPRIIWPETTFYDIAMPSGRHLYAQLAPEPNYRWMEYCQRSMRIAEELDVSRIITLGSMFAQVPHTRQLPLEETHLSERMNTALSAAADDADCSDDTHDGPAGITTILDIMASNEGLDSSALWVSVPQYLGTDECPQGTLQILRRLSLLTGLAFDEGQLPKKSAIWKAQASMLVSCNDELKDYVHHMEQNYDQEMQIRGLSDEIGKPEAEQLIKEAEEFLDRHNSF